MSKGIIQPSISFETVLRLQQITGKPIRRGFDSVLNEILDDYENLIKKEKPTSKHDPEGEFLS